MTNAWPTLAWWVDGNCLTRLSDKVLNRIIERIELKFVKKAVTRGDKHTFLGMKLRFPGNGMVLINMQDYIK